jgi:uroporphyrinogen decarboxylase
MTKRERIWAAVHGEQPDTLPYSFWTHLPGIDLDPEKLAETTYEFYRTYDVDFIKTMNNGMYAIEDFGCEIDYSEVPKGGVAKVVKTPIQKGEDWYGLKPCSVEQGSLARELKGLRLLLDRVKGEDVPVIFTVFSPLTIANKISGNTLYQHISQGHSAAVHYALQVITQTTCDLARTALDMGADGIFFAAQSSTYHAHGTNIMFELLKDYPVQVFNWHAWETLPAVDEAAIMTGKCLMGGLKRTDITQRDRNAIQHQIYECYRLLGGRNQILTPGCVIRYPLDKEMLAYVKQAKDFVERKMRTQ